MSEAGRQLRLDLRVYCASLLIARLKRAGHMLFSIDPTHTPTARVAPRSYDELVEPVQKSFMDLKIEKLENEFLSVQSCMAETLKTIRAMPMIYHIRRRLLFVDIKSCPGRLFPPELVRHGTFFLYQIKMYMSFFFSLY